MSSEATDPTEANPTDDNGHYRVVTKGNVHEEHHLIKPEAKITQEAHKIEIVDKMAPDTKSIYFEADQEYIAKRPDTPAAIKEYLTKMKIYAINADDFLVNLTIGQKTFSIKATKAEAESLITEWEVQDELIAKRLEFHDLLVELEKVLGGFVAELKKDLIKRAE